MSPSHPQPESHPAPSPYHYQTSHPSDIYQPPHPHPHQPYQYPIPGTNDHPPQPWLSPMGYHQYPQQLSSRPQFAYTYANHSSSSSLDLSHGYTIPLPHADFSSSASLGPLHTFHPGQYRIHPPAHPGDTSTLGDDATYLENLVPSPLFGVTEVHDQSSISRPPTRDSFRTHSRHTSTSTSAHSGQSGGSEYQPIAVKSALAKSKSGPRGKSKVQAVDTPPVLGPRKRQPPSHLSFTVDVRPKPKAKPVRKGRLTSHTDARSPTPLPVNPLSPIAATSDMTDPDGEGEEEESTYPPSSITCENVQYPILEAPPGTTYSVNNFVILIPAKFAPPGTDIVASPFEQYSCRLCRKTYSGKNARSVARRHLQDKHAVRLELQERRSRWDRNAGRPKDAFEKDERNRANKADWARKHRLAEKERIGAALQKDQYTSISRARRGKKRASTPITSSTTSTTHSQSLSYADFGPSVTLNSLADMASPLFSSDGDVDDDEADISCETTLAILHGSAHWSHPAGVETDGIICDVDHSLPAEQPQSLTHQSAPGSYAPTHHTDSPLSSSPDPTVLGQHQQWAVPEGWHDMTAHQMISWMTFPPDENEEEGTPPSASTSARITSISQVERDMQIDPQLQHAPSVPAPILPPAALAAETLLNLHSSPTRHPPSSTSTPRPVLSRPTPLRRFTLGSSSSSAIMCSSALSMPSNPYTGWSNHTPQGLETPISLRAPVMKARRRDENEVLGEEEEKRMPVGRERLAGIGERSLSFSAFTPVGGGRSGLGLGMEDDPFHVDSAVSRSDRGKENVDGGVREQRSGGEKRAGLDGSPIPFRKRQPLNAIINPPTFNSASYHPSHSINPISRHHSSSSLSSTLVAPNTHLHQPVISPLKRQGGPSTGFATPISRKVGSYRFSQALFGKTPGTIMAGGGSRREGDSENRPSTSRWMLSSPAGNGMAAELGLVGTYGYVEGLETPMRGVVESETPARG